MWYVDLRYIFHSNFDETCEARQVVAPYRSPIHPPLSLCLGWRGDAKIVFVRSHGFFIHVIFSEGWCFFSITNRTNQNSFDEPLFWPIRIRWYPRWEGDVKRENSQFHKNGIFWGPKSRNGRDRRVGEKKKDTGEQKKKQIEKGWQAD